MPYSKPLELAALDGEDKIEAAARAPARRVRAAGRGSLMATEIPMPRLSDTMERGHGRALGQEGRRHGRRGRGARRHRDRQGDDGARELRERRPAEDPRAGGRVGRARRADRARRRGRRDGRGPAAERRRAGGGARTRPPPAEPDAGASEQPKPGGPPAAARPAPQANGGGELRASPIARRMAADAGLDLRPLAGRGSGPDGRIVKVDVERLAAEGARRRAAAPHLRRRRAAAPPPAPRSRRLGGGRGHEADRHAARRRAAHDGVEAERPALLPAVRGRHDPGDRAPARDQPLARRGRHEGLDQRSDHPRLRRLADRAPAVPPLLARRSHRAPRARPHRHRGGARRRPDRAGAARRGSHDPDRDRGRDARDIVARARSRQGAPARDRGRHVHRLEPRHVRRHVVRGDHQPAGARHPRGRPHHRAARDRRRPGRRAPDHGRHALGRPPRRVGSRRRTPPAGDRRGDWRAE